MTQTHARLNELVRCARAGDVQAFGLIVVDTQAMACAVALSVLRDPGLAQDAAQEAYLRAFRRLRDLEEPAGFVTWFRRIVITVALNLRRSRRTTLLQVDDVPDVPVLDEAEASWTDAQRQRLSAALLTLTPAERRLCDRRYHGGWSVGRLAQDAGVPEPVMRKRLQRVRDKLRKEIDVSEQRGLTPDAMRPDLPAVVVELLARPQLTDLPEHPVGLRQLPHDLLRGVSLPRRHDQVLPPISMGTRLSLDVDQPDGVRPLLPSVSGTSWSSPTNDNATETPASRGVCTTISTF